MDNEAYDQRAQLNTNEKGEYCFLTILPGKYLLDEVYRPAHIHFRVTEKNSQELISQFYFKGDPKIEKDRWASLDRAKLRILPITPEDNTGNLSVEFDIYLKEK